MNRDTFLKEQLESVQKALTKQPVPLKQKHARRLIIGTHCEKSCSLFWKNVTTIQLEKNALLTWKFCYLLHKLIRDGHESVPVESYNHLRRISQLGDFWRNMHTSGLESYNALYCKIICERLEFHRKYTHIPGNFIIPWDVISAARINNEGALMTSIDVINQIDNLLLLQRTVFDSRELLGWSSLAPQGQVLLAPICLVIWDISPMYDLLLQLMFHHHTVYSPESLALHRNRFQMTFDRMNLCYDEARKVQYFKYLTNIPILPEVPPNFLTISAPEECPANNLKEEGPTSGVETLLATLQHHERSCCAERPGHSTDKNDGTRVGELLATLQIHEDNCSSSNPTQTPVVQERDPRSELLKPD